MCLLFPIEGACSPLRMGAMGERILQPLVHKALTNTEHGVATHLEGFGHLLIGPALSWSGAIDFQEDTSVGEFSGWGFAFRDQLLERVALPCTQGDFMFV